MEIKEVEYILCIQREGSLTKAAEKLYISQPALSKFLKETENRMGIKIFERVEKEYRPTFAGKKYIDYCERIYNLNQELNTEIHDILNKDIGKLKIAFPTMRATYLIHNTLPAFKEIFPNVVIDIKEEHSGVLEDLLIKGQVELAFFNRPVINKDICYEVLKQEELVLVTKANPEISSKAVWKSGCKYRWIDINLLKDQQFILQLPEQRSRMACEEVFKNSGFTPNNPIVIKNIWATLNMISSGFGVGMLSDTHPEHLRILPRPEVFSVGNPPVKMDFVVAYRKGAYLSRYAKEFIKIVEKAINI